MDTSKLPTAAMRVADDHPDIWNAYQTLGKAVSLSGPLTDREKRLVKLAYAIAADSQGATHSHTRRAVEEDIPLTDIRQIALLAIPTVGLPTAMKGVTWIEDILTEK